MARCDVENSPVVSQTSYCFVDQQLEISSIIRACFGIVHKSNCRSMKRRTSLSIEESDRTGVPMNGGTTSDACIWRLVLAYLFPMVKWPTRMGFRELLVVLLCFLLTTDVANASIKCPQACICSDSPVMNPGGQLSINCSNLNLLRYTLHYSHILEHNTTYNSSSNAYNNNKTIEAVHELYSLYLSHNSLTSVKPDLVFVDLPSTNDSFLIKVQIFNISHNNILTISREELSVFHEIKTLDASYNKIQKLDGDVFTGLTSLISINLSHNAIEDIGNETFLNLDELEILDLSYNNIHVFAIGNLPALSSLQYLYLNGNNIQSIYSSFINISPSLPQLSSLDLSSNQIIDIPANQFQCCPGLRTLNMANNSIEGVNEYFLKGLYSLQELALDYNEISSINQPVFQNTSLVKLSLSNMPNLRNISHNAFLGLSKLLYLNLRHNSELSFLQPNLLTPLTRLQTLDVSSCGLTQLSSITFHKNEDLREIHLQNNPLSCSCVNAWLAAEASNNYSKFLDAGSLSCLSYDGRHHHFQNASSDCQEIVIHNTSSSTANSKLGSQILFTCQHQTQNPEIVMWTTPRGKIFYQHHFHPEASQHLLSPEDIRPDSDFHNGHYWHHTSTYHSDLSSYEDRVMILTDGSLYIDYMLRSDAGLYRCQISNAEYNQTITINLYVECTVSSSVKIFGCIVGLLCAVSFFTLNLIYVIISWTARRLVNKRRREIIRQMLESLNAYKSLQIARIHENYTHQLSRVRNQYHVQCNRLHRNYSLQVTRMKRGCSNQVERVRDNYHSKLTHLREYSSSQIMQIRERANCQIIRIRDYGSTQLEKLRETYKLQHQHVMKLLDTMNLENCRNVVETECMRAESMMYDIDLLGDDDRTDSPTSTGESEYSTAASSPSSSLEDDHHEAGLRRDMTHDNRELSTGSSDNSGAIREVQTTIDLEIGLETHISDAWNSCDDRHEHPHKSRKYLKSGQCPDEDQHFLQLQGSQTHLQGTSDLENIKRETPLPVLHLHRDQFGSGIPTSQPARAHRRSDSDATYDGLYMTPEASPTKFCSQLNSVPTFQHMDRDSRPRKHKRNCDKNDKDSGSREESAV